MLWAKKEFLSLPRLIGRGQAPASPVVREERRRASAEAADPRGAGDGQDHAFERSTGVRRGGDREFGLHRDGVQRRGDAGPVGGEREAVLGA